MSDFNFGSLATQVADMVTADANPSEAQPSATEPVVTQPTTTEQTATSTQQSPAITDPAQTGQPAAEPTYEIDLGNGRTERLTKTQLTEAYQNGLRQADYTRKTQELAKQRQEVEAIVQQLQMQQQHAQQLLNNPQALLQAAQAQLQQQQAQQIDPTQPVTMGQLQQMMMHMQAQAQQQVQQVQQAAHQIVEDRLQVAEYAESFNDTLNSLYKEHPILKIRPEFEDILRYNVIRQNPQSLEDATRIAKDFSAQFVADLSKPFIQQQQEREAQRAKLAATGTEPPGMGAAPQPTAPNYRTTDGKLDWRKLSEAAAALANGG